MIISQMFWTSKKLIENSEFKFIVCVMWKCDVEMYGGRNVCSMCDKNISFEWCEKIASKSFEHYVQIVSCDCEMRALENFVETFEKGWCEMIFFAWCCEKKEY